MNELIISKPRNIEEFEQIRNISCLTGDNGKPIAEYRWKFFSEFWIGPYQKIIPNWTTIAIKNHKIIGYLTGCPRISPFENIVSKFFFYLNIVIRYYDVKPDIIKFLKRIFKIEKSPLSYFSQKVLKLIRIEYPSHLHINLLSECRGQDIGKQLLIAFEGDLKKQNIVGIHVFCAEGPLRFYLKNGFQILEQISYLNSTKVFCLGKKL